MDTIVDIEAARALNAARVQLEAINARPFYVRDTYTGPVKDLLAATLTKVCGDEGRAQQVFDRMLDGVDVAEALADARRQWIGNLIGNTLTFDEREGCKGFVADDGVSVYQVWRYWSPDGDRWTLSVCAVDDADSTETLHGLPSRWAAEFVAAARSGEPGWYHADKPPLAAARESALAAIEKLKCHGCARDAHVIGHVPTCPQETDGNDRTGNAEEGVKA